MLPVSVLAIWVQRQETRATLEAAQDTQSVMASSLTAAISRYVADLESVFEMAAAHASTGHEPAGMRELLARMHFHHLCVVDKDYVIRFWLALDGKVLKGRIRDRLIEHLDPQFKAAAADATEVFFSAAGSDYAGRPTVWMVRSLSDGRFALGGVSTEFLVTLARQVSFGRGGHAAIVDSRGRVLAHPKDDWRKELKDLSGVGPVKAMIERKSGSMVFHSPATQSDMVAGYAVVPRTGWGVMVPMPMAAIEARAAEFGRAAWLVVLVGFAAALVASWFVARHLTDPIRAVADAARQFTAGRLDARAPVPMQPVELKELGSSFNAMAAEVEAKNVALSQAVGRAEAASRTKSDFLANVSHEVRTPLNAILGFSELMRASIYGPMGHPKYVNYVEHIHNSAQHLLGLVNTVLDLSKAESGMLDVTLESVDVAAIVAECAPMVETQAKSGGIRLVRRVEGRLPHARADRNRLKQVLLNLLSNAVKFTPAGGEISIEAERAGDHGVRIRVRDTGIGIEEKDIPRVLAPFGRVESPWHRRQEGTGLGLPLSRRMMDAMGGQFTLTSVPGLGTVATIELPASDVPATASAQPIAAQ